MSKEIDVIKGLCVGPAKERVAKIYELEETLAEMPQVDIPHIDKMHGGMYYREITIPKDTLLTGQLYKFDHLDIMISGDITVSSEDSDPIRLKGYNVFFAKAGKKRAGYAHEDTTWMTVHPFVGENGDQVQDMITADTPEELEEFYKMFAAYVKGDE